MSLRGTKSNRDAIGARVEVDGQVKWLSAGSAYLSQHSKLLHFGLADRERAEKVRIYWPSGELQKLEPLAAGFRYEITEGSAEFRAIPLQPRKEFPADASFHVENHARLETTWFWEPVPLPEKRRGPSLFVLHAGEPLPRPPAAVDSLDLRHAHPDLAAAYAIFRRYLFDYRVPSKHRFGCSSIAKVACARSMPMHPDDAGASRLALTRRTRARLARPAFPGFYLGHPTRDYYKFGGALLQAGYPEQALPYLEEMLRRTPDNARPCWPSAAFICRRSVCRRPARRSNAALALEPRRGPKAGTSSAAWKPTRAIFPKPCVVTSGRWHWPPIFPTPWSTPPRRTRNSAIQPKPSGSIAMRCSADPRSGDAANGLGLLLAQQGKTGEARRLFELAISIRRDDSSAINNLAVLYRKYRPGRMMRLPLSSTESRRRPTTICCTSTWRGSGCKRASATRRATSCAHCWPASRPAGLRRKVSNS